MTQMPAHTSSSLRRSAVTAAFSLMLVTLWALTHRYHGFARDGELYAFQAMAEIDPTLGSDLYLRNTSQDHYTIFSPVYAFFIRAVGLQSAELWLFSLCAVWFVAAAWYLARELSTTDQAWLAVALLVITVGTYGAYQIFGYLENYLTARSMGEALIVTALACHFRGWRRAALLVALAALFIHPLMALPGILLLICLWLPIRVAMIGAVSGVVAALAIALAALLAPAVAKYVTVMDPAWLEVVRERSQFLFLKYWTSTDWEIAARPFVCLTLTALAVPDLRVRKLCFGAMLVGCSGLAVAFIACTVGPVAILLQGQAWRWVWITVFTSVLLLVPAAWHIWKDEACGPLCATFLILGWTYPGVDGLACVAGALILWLIREHLPPRAARYMRWAAAAIGFIVVVWVLANGWTFSSTAIPESGRESLIIGRLREIFGLGASAVLLVGLFWYWIRRTRSTWVISLTCAPLLAAALWILPGSVKQLDTVGSQAEIATFADWRNAIPPSSNVLIVPTRKSASFMWFTLGRPSYLSVDQSSGVVFSRATSLEVRRRSEVLLPLGEPDWKILTQITEERSAVKEPGSATRPAAASRQLTSKILVDICTDPQLDFVIAKEDVGFTPLRHDHVGGLRGWNLYDCRRVRSGMPVA